MHIMEIVSGTGVNGAVVHCLLLTRALARRRHRVTLVCPPGAWIADQLGSTAVEVVVSDLHRWPPDELRRVARVARDTHADVLHTHMSRAHFFGVLLRWVSGVPCVATAHSRHIQLHWMCNDGVIAVSEATARFHRTYNLVRPGRMAVIHNFVDDQRFAAVSPTARSLVRRAFGLDETAALIGSIGEISPAKGVVHLVRALPDIRAAVPDVRLLAVGGGSDDYRAQVQREAEQLGVTSLIRWAGPRGDVPEIMAALDVFVLPSLEENFPLVVAEAMAAGLPVVATAVGGLPECVGDGETGVLVPAADSGALAAAIIALLRDPGRRRRFGEAGRKRVRECFSAERQVPLIEAAMAGAAARFKISR